METDRTSEPRHPMNIVSRRTGLKPDLIRAWEKRHRAIEPARTATNRRLYSDRDIDRLLRLRDAVRCGWPIGQLARLSDDELVRLVAEAGDLEHAPGTRSAPDGQEGRDFESATCASSLRAIERLDLAALQAILDDAAVRCGRHRLLDHILFPLRKALSDELRSGGLRAVHERFAMAVLRPLIDSLEGAFLDLRTGPLLVISAPSREQNELLGLLVAATARSEDWRASFLGANLPAEEIVALVRTKRARALALTLTEDDHGPKVERAVRRTGRLLADVAPLFTVGPLVEELEPVVMEAGGIPLPDLARLRERLERLREFR